MKKLVEYVRKSSKMLLIFQLYYLNNWLKHENPLLPRFKLLKATIQYSIYNKQIW